MTSATPARQTIPNRRQVRDVDRHVGVRMRQRRIMMGLTQGQMADAMGISYQQAHKYETGANRISVGRLFTAAQVLDVEISFFFEGLDGDSDSELTPKQRQLLTLTRNFLAVPSREHQETICSLAKALARDEAMTEVGTLSLNAD